jgi:hypothetical protein
MLFIDMVTSGNALLNLQRLLLVNGLPALWKVCNLVYPHEPITISDVGHFYSVMGETPFPNFRIPRRTFSCHPGRAQHRVS